MCVGSSNEKENVNGGQTNVVRRGWFIAEMFRSISSVESSVGWKVWRRAVSQMNFKSETDLFDSYCISELVDVNYLFMLFM